ncbi:hypothetical protein DAEQUDRAFT_723656 [Daedalea quercina L-15889]|uniref:Uncharacterized protein n=1 Tax=Daedalea quercina L-15889 TaxID=1314783 RepID=A0A165SHR7_9APHY|nr:hypothetical protein DAEQUDRAFT_723656 [Daedalea quercina L-15889]
MCYWLVTYMRYTCGHEQQTGSHYIDCHMSTCVISTHHRQEDHDCANTCLQEMIEDQHIVMERTTVACDVCRGIPPASRSAGGRNSSSAARTN